MQEKVPNALSGTTWTWQQTVYDDGTKVIVPKPYSYTLRFLPDGKMALRADCNMAGGSYKLNEKEITIDITHSTLAACPPESLDRRYIRDLTVSHDYVLEGTALRINLKFGMGAKVTRLSSMFSFNNMLSVRHVMRHD
jgi:heat shock protein HslJ